MTNSSSRWVQLATCSSQNQVSLTLHAHNWLSESHKGLLWTLWLLTFNDQFLMRYWIFEFSWEEMAVGKAINWGSLSRSTRWTLGNPDWSKSGHFRRPLLSRIGHWIHLPEWYSRAGCQLIQMDQAKDLWNSTTCSIRPLCGSCRCKNHHLRRQR